MHECNHKDINYLLNEKRSKIINTNPTKYIFQLKNIKNNFQQIDIKQSNINNKKWLDKFLDKISNSDSSSDDNSFYSSNSYTTTSSESSNEYKSNIKKIKCRHRIKYRKYSYLDYPFYNN